MSVLGKLSAVAVLSVALVAAVATPVSAAPAKAEAKVKWTVVGPRIYFNKAETQKISVGAGATATFAAALPPPFDLIVAGLAAGLAAQAGLAAIDGNCVGVRILPPLPFLPLATPFTYKPSAKNGGLCR